MQSWKVDWTTDAKQQLAAHWISAPDRNAVTIAADHIDQLLASDPRDLGQALPEELWKIVVQPLIAYFELHPATQTVEVTGVVMVIF